ncbi:hypothetical protein GGR57DRAFT_512956 [Xylariaceae sp. FL1272]|nr:hypothetical protein GGR57DRAFT_512956 [Xylariaceae sp. FL1272]
MSLSAEQVESYLMRIELPQSAREQLRQGPNGPNALKAVQALQQSHLRTVPFENLDLIYSAHHSIQTDIDLVYDHVVKQGRGGVCDSLHPLFARLLRFFGFSVYLTGSRMNSSAALLADPSLDKYKPKFGPWIHLNTIVRIGERQYIVDTGHGPTGSPFPVPLVHDEPVVDIYPRQRRMIYCSLPGLSDPAQKWWRLQLRYPADKDWMDVWAFTETEWLEVDIQMLRMAYSAMGTGWVAPRPNRAGETKVVQKLFSEYDRVTVLADEFGIGLTDEDQKQIVGYDAELKDEDFDYYA